MTQDNEPTVAAEELRTIVERLESIASERKVLGEVFADILAEADSKGYDKKAIRQVLKIRAADRAELEAQEEVVQLYLRTLS